MFLVGLTGNFGMGKSFVLSAFRALGAVTLDCDRIVAMLLRERTVVSWFAEVFGSEVVAPDGGLDKKAVSRKMFSDSGIRKAVEAYLHPMVFGRIEWFLSQMTDQDRVMVVEVPLLYEAGHADRFRHVITVFTDEKTAISRAVAEGFSEEDVVARLNAQIPIEIKKERADFRIDNNGAEEETLKQVEAIYRQVIKEKSEAPGR